MQTILIRLLLILPLLASPLIRAQETVRLKAADGHPLTGSCFKPVGTPRGGVVLLHMYRTSRISYSPLSARLAANGFHVLALDMRGHGDSILGPDGKAVSVSREVVKDAKTNPFLKMHGDALAGLNYLTSRGAPADRLAIVGASVGCSVALHTAVLYPKKVAAIVLLTPGTDYLGVPSLTHAGKYGDRPALLLTSEQEASEGAQPLKELMTGTSVQLEIFPEKRIHGTHMFGKVLGVEARIIHWLQEALIVREILDIPYERRVLVDGEFGAEEAPGSLLIPVTLSKDRKGTIRLSHGGKKLYVGFDLNERCMRRNGVEIFINVGARGPSLPDETCYRISFAPKNGPRPAVVLQRGEKGSWKEASASGVLAQYALQGRLSWSAEIAINLEKLLGTGEPGPFRIAFQVNGSVESEKHSHPEGAGIATAPRTWLLANCLPRSR